MAEDDDRGEGKLPRVDHGPLNEGAVGKINMEFSIRGGKEGGTIFNLLKYIKFIGGSPN